jgi:hypothetical protein
LVSEKSGNSEDLEQAEPVLQVIVISLPAKMVLGENKKNRKKAAKNRFINKG